MRRGIDTYRLSSDWDPKNPDHLDQLNRTLIEIQQRLDTIQSIGARVPIAPQTVTATGKQGVIWLTWRRVKNADGYILVYGTDSTMVKILGRRVLADSETCDYQLPVGNVAVTYYFRIYTYRGNQVSDPSPTASAASVSFGAGEAA